MFNCVLTAIEAPVDVLILIAVTVFQAFKQIRFVTWEHSVDILGPQTICKSLVIRECGLFLFGGQYIFHFFNEIAVGTVKSLDIGTHCKEYLCKCIRRQVTNDTAQEVGFYDSANLGNLIQGQEAAFL